MLYLAWYPDLRDASRNKHVKGEEDLPPLALLDAAKVDLDRTRHDVMILRKTLTTLEELKRERAQLRELQTVVQEEMPVSSASKRSASELDEDENSDHGPRSKASKSGPSYTRSSNVILVRR